MRFNAMFSFGLVVSSVLLLACCTDDGTEADRLGIGAACTTDTECMDGQSCLTDFKGGYCGVLGCTSAANCPEASACVAHDDGKNYCFRTCGTKTDCNANRTSDNESNCSSSVTFTDAAANKDIKACVPPSS